MAEIILPRFSEDTLESVIVFWHKAEGDRVKAGDVLVEVQTEKAVSEIEAEEEGFLTQIIKKRGDVAEVGEALAILTTVGERLVDEDSSSPSDDVQTEESLENPVGSAFVRVPPRVRKRARELGIDLASVVGTGPKGLPTIEDVEAAAANKAEETIPFTPSRKVTAERMMKSLHGSAQLTLTAWADVTELKEWRDSQNEKISWTTLCLYAVTQALKAHPEFNAHVQGDTVQPFTSINLGVAVDAGANLHVPVIKNAESMLLKEMYELASDNILKAQRGKLTVEDYKDGTFTVTNLGNYGIEFFTPIINPPQVAILGIGAIETQLAIEYGDVVEKARLPLSLTFDHRVNDGGPAARFLQSVIQEFHHISETVPQ